MIDIEEIHWRPNLWETQPNEFLCSICRKTFYFYYYKNWDSLSYFQTKQSIFSEMHIGFVNVFAVSCDTILVYLWWCAIKGYACTHTDYITPRNHADKGRAHIPLGLVFGCISSEIPYWNRMFQWQHKSAQLLNESSN